METRQTPHIGRQNPNAESQVGLLPSISTALKKVFEKEGMIRDDVSYLNQLLTESGSTESRVDSRHVEALIALGVIGRVISGGTSRLTWIADPNGASFLPLVSKGHREADKSDVEKSNSTISDNDVFKLDIELDIEHEKLVLYRVLLVVEGIAAILLLRAIVLWYFQL